MIPANLVHEVINFNRKDLEQVAVDSGYYDEYVSSEFLGIVENQFVFEIGYINDEGGLDTGRVYVTYSEDGNDNCLVLDY